MGCKVLSDAAEDNIRIGHFIVRDLCLQRSLFKHRLIAFLFQQPILAELRREVHMAVPHLCEGLRNALRERQQQQGSQSGSPAMTFPPSMQSGATGDFGLSTTYSRPTSAGSGDFGSLPSVDSFTHYTADHSAGPGPFAFGGEAVGGIDYFSSGCDSAFPASTTTSLVPNGDSTSAVPSSYFSSTKSLSTLNTTATATASWFDFTAPHSS